MVSGVCIYETTFHLMGHINRHSCHIWRQARPHVI